MVQIIGLQGKIERLEKEKKKLIKKFQIKANRRAMKCQICYSDELGKVSDIKNSDDRFEALMDFFLKIQDITYRETKREFLRNWRRFMK